jgi:hypothetical protein
MAAMRDRFGLRRTSPAAAPLLPGGTGLLPETATIGRISVVFAP